jgi:CubicO group peptidase (beta-lactamase class C family)
MRCKPGGLGYARGSLLFFGAGVLLLPFLIGRSQAQTPKPPIAKKNPAPAARAPKAPKVMGLDAARLALIPARMKAFVDRGRAAGIVTLVAHRGQVVQLSAVGNQDNESQTPMKTDSIFQVASMTKPVTAIGIQLLVEDGLLAITDPVQKHLPGFAKIQLLTRGAEGDLQEVRKPARPITIRDLLTHTSGMGSGYPDPIKDLFDKRDRTLAEAVELFPQRPLEFEPGSQWGYSNMGIATLGRIIEVVSGKRYEDFLTERLFTPLGMKDSHFFLPEDKRERLAAIYRYDGSTLARADLDLYRPEAKYPAPEAGLFSTAPDLFRLYQMMLNGGSFGGRRILSQASVEVMTRNHTGELKAGFSPGMGFGLGWSVVRNVDGMFRLNSIGTFGHGGLYRTYGFVDPQKELVGVILLQRLSSDGDLADEISAFLAMASAAVSE